MNLKDLIRPDDRVVGRLLATAHCVGPLPDEARVGRLCHALRGWDFAERLGPSSGYGPVEQARSGNCIDLATILCSALRAASVERTYVVLGSEPNQFPVNVHTWVLVGIGESRWLLIDSKDRTPQPIALVDVPTKIMVLAVWNEREAFLSPQDREAFWAHDNDSSSAARTNS